MSSFQEMQTLVLDFLSGQTEPKSTREISAGIERPFDKVQPAIIQLCIDDLLVFAAWDEHRKPRYRPTGKDTSHD